MKTHKIVFLLIILQSSIYSFGQGKWTHYTKKEGLASTWIRDCLQDKNGNMWFATDKGLNKYDGEKLESYTEKDGLPKGFIKNIYEDKEGNIWIFSGKMAFNPLALIVSFVPIQYYKDVGVSILYKDNKINYLNNNKTGENYFGAICKDLEGNVWVGGYNENNEKNFILKNFDGRSWQSLSQFGRFDYAPFFKFYVDDKSDIWTFSFEENFITRFEGTNSTSFGKEDGLPVKQNEKLVQIIVKDSKNNLWFGASSEGKYGSLMKFDGTNWTTYNEENGVIGKSINKIVEDNNGNIWVATNMGINIFDGTSWKYFSEKNDIAIKYVEAMTVDSKGRVWIGTSEGLILFDQGIWSTINKKNGLTHNFIRSIVEDSKGNIWVGAASTWKSGGVSVYDGKAWKNLELPKLWANIFFEDSKGNMWIATFGNGVIKYEY
ncbi:MAG: hypothetical protein JXJ22_17835 [Bacteroidales bacterium]|nr:hypothetical protein [Bacteroidales bacterium]